MYKILIAAGVIIVSSCGSSQLATSENYGPTSNNQPLGTPIGTGNTVIEPKVLNNDGRVEGLGTSKTADEQAAIDKQRGFKIEKAK